METIVSKVYFDLGAGWVLNTDVLLDPPLTWEYGLRGDGPIDLLASTGIAIFHLDNYYTNSAGDPGLYSPGHTNLLAGFGEGTPVKITIHNGAAEIVKFIGTIAGIRPSSGLFEYPYVEVEAHDWIGYLSGQEVGIVPLQEAKRVDQALTTALVNFPIQPTATDFDTGIETFLLMFNNTTPGMSMARLFQSLCNNELARIYLEGDGTLRLENRNTRAEVITPAFTLPGLMVEIEPSYERSSIYNIVNVIIEPIEASPGADVLLWDEKVAEYFGGVIPSILPGESIVLKCPFTDPALGGGISALDVVDPITVIEFGSKADFESNDMIDDLGQSQSIGANASIVTLTNNGAKIGYLNDLQIYGRALYHYRTQILTAINSTSINAGTGEKRFSLKPDQITETEKAQAYAHYILGMVGTGRMRSVRIRVLANQTNALRVGLIAAEVSTLFSVAESVTGVDYDFYVNRIKYSQDSEALWVDLFAGSADRYNCFVWDRSHWDSDFDARWAI